MQLEEVQLAIRPRTILECFDVAFLFCGRHWFGLALTAGAGMIPFACLNWWVVDIRDLNIYQSYLLLLMEIPWATMWITLYLGQTIFSSRLSRRRMIVDGLRAIPGLFIFQGFIRLLCMAPVVLSPVVFVGMYFVNEIILLEKAPLSKIWSRRIAMNKQILERIFAIRLLELLVLMIGWRLLASLFQAISSLWEDESHSFMGMFEEPEWINQSVVSDWQGHAAFWVTIVFLTVFRFVSYLDCRIRREGWDVELKMRARAEFYRQREAAE